ncbi:hypothetical protein [Ureibacillus aquaedulcis]|uniref:Glycosyl transferase family 2 n=1 Tax=Ureibacillus aquaedulcis TaxID=3058421 RepID=A0ABT8GMP8_9BACL|nr:hypothetical protein [Ureibacillus sp. BA0131]MDN4492690.1 hypothetical protein [Ureibacillus sp. BA0131]
MKKIYIGISVFLFLLVGPVLIWFLDNGNELSVAIIDKTVPQNDYREHSGITWLLNHEKIKKDDSDYEFNKDYYGYNPVKDQPVGSLPDNYNDYDVIYLADTYGVYEDDLLNENEVQGTRSEKIYGGLEQEEWNAIAQRLSSDEKSLLIAEYNTFASPTYSEVRESVTNYLGLNWDGWIGRYFSDLSLSSIELPQWVKEEYGENWSYKGAGFLLVNDLTSQVEVLELNKHVKDEGIQLAFTEQGQQKFDLMDSPEYSYWFDIVTPTNGAVALANYKWSLTNEGQEKLKNLGIPEQFAAVVEQSHDQSKSYYFAGDYNDVNNLPPFYQVKSLPTVYKFLKQNDETAFYWSVYFPMMKKLLDGYEAMDSAAPTKGQEQGLQYTSRIKENKIEVKIEGKWQPITIKGINLGMGKPGAFPGEAAITEDEYYRWFESIADMNANMIRVYTIHPPGFYNALKRFNESSDQKLYILHGTWINEEGLEETLDAYDEETLKDFQHEIQSVVDIIHGNATLEERAGHASGVYNADVSEYIAGWIIGIEWYPHMVQGTNEKHQGISDYNGEFVYTKDAPPFEHWMAEQMDYMLNYEFNRYGWIRPISFTNWVTTDLLEHPSEPDRDEDLVSINPNVIYLKGEAEKTGQFASYHAYPYYPDFLNYDQKLLNYVDHRGNKNSYAGYLSALHEAHRLPVLIAEFGIPSSRGLTHENPYGWNQGFMSENDQGEALKSLFEDILAENLMGGLIFTWQDEWFKRTWNTLDYDNPDRRPYWSNAQTNEQQFGLLSFDRFKIKVDGDANDWDSEPLYEEDTALSVDFDEKYLYLKIEGEGIKENTPHILFDVMADQGNTKIEKWGNLALNNGVDFMATVSRNEADSRILIDPYYDLFTFMYGQQGLNMLKPAPPLPTKNSGKFRQINYVLSSELEIPNTGELIPLSTYEAGKLREGNGNPESEKYDSLADYMWAEDLLELRIPWLLLQARDPSQREFIGDLQNDGMSASVKVRNISIGVVFENDGEITGSIPGMSDRQLSLLPYSWDTWNEPEYSERLKESYYIMQEAFEKVK